MAEQTQKLNNYDLSGGQNSLVSPLFLKDNECELVQNYHMDYIGGLTKRKGITYLIGQVESAKPISSLFQFIDKSGNNYDNLLIGIDKADDSQGLIRTIDSDGTAWDDSKTSETLGSVPVFCTLVNYIFRTNSNEVVGSNNNPLGAWGTTNCPTTIKPKYCKVWEDRVYVANNNLSGALRPSRIYWSSLPSETGTLTWTTSTDYADINPDDGDEITWIEPSGSKLLIFKNRGLYRWTFGQVEPDKIIDIGTPEGRSVAQTHGICFFANNYGAYAYTSGQPKMISKKVQPFIDAVSNTNIYRSACDNDHYYLYIGDVIVDSISYANVMLVYTISLNTWHIETYPFEIKAMARFERDTIPKTTDVEIYDNVYLGDDAGYIYRKGIGNTDDNGTTAGTINGRIITKEYPLNFPKNTELKNLYVLAQKARGAKVNYRIDRGKWKPWKDLKERINEGRLSGRAKTIQLSFTDNSILTPSRIEGFTVEYKPKEEIRRK